jgi:hypothetical protein
MSAAIFNKDDLSDFSFKIVIRNDTSGITIVDSEVIEILKIHERGVSLSLKKQICMPGHGLTICFIQLPLQKELTRFEHIKKFDKRIELVGKAIEVDKKEDSDFVQIKVHFTQFKASLWEQFTEAFEKRQKLVEDMKHKL